LEQQHLKGVLDTAQFKSIYEFAISAKATFVAAAYVERGYAGQWCNVALL